MTGLDEIDREILDLLIEDARRPYREIADEVDRSPPTVSERIERLWELGVIERFTLDLDRSLLIEGQTLLVRLDVVSVNDERVAKTVGEVPAVEHVIRTVEGSVLCLAHTDEAGVRDLLAGVIDDEHVRDYSVRLVAESSWEPTLGEIPIGIECAVCGKAVDSGGVSVELGERTYEVCCSSCVAEIEAQYDELERAAESD